MIIPYIMENKNCLKLETTNQKGIKGFNYTNADSTLGISTHKGDVIGLLLLGQIGHIIHSKAAENIRYEYIT